MRMSICPRGSHEGTPRSESLTSVIQLLPPVLFRRNSELSAKPLIGSGVIHSRTTNKIYPPGGRHAALQAGAWSYGRCRNSTGWQEGASPLGGGPQMKPNNRQLSWHCHQLKGVFCQIFHALFAIATSPVSGGF